MINISQKISENINTKKQPVIEASKLGLCYRRSGRFAFGKNRHLRKKKDFWALRDISFTIHKGDCVGIIGRNGSGKSSLSMLCAGILKPDEGNITIYEKSRLLALGVGFRPEFTGRENIVISASILGLSRKEIAAVAPSIEEFAELDEFIDEPVRIYSSGMKSRLGFAIATTVKSEILIVDEVMSTGDASFKKKAEERMQKMLQEAGTVVLVSHSPGSIRKMCNRVLWLDRSRLVMDADPVQAIKAYNQFCQELSN